MNNEYPSREEWVRDFWAALAEQDGISEDEIELSYEAQSEFLEEE